MDETTLTSTLRALAADAPLHPAPSADARRRASRLRRSRRTAAAGFAAVVAIVVVGAVALQPAAKPGVSSTTPSWISELRDPHNPNHATTGYIGMSRQNGGQWIVYWQGRRLCYETVSANGALLASDCSAPVPVTSSMTPAIAAESNTGNRILGTGDGGLFYAVAPAVSDVAVHTLPVSPFNGYSPDDSGLTPVGEADFPASVVVAEGTVVSLWAADDKGQQLGATIPGPAAPQFRQVLGTFDCSDTGHTGFDAIVPDRADPKSCYGLAPSALTVVPKSATAIDDPTLGWLVQVSLNDQDAKTLGTLTQRVATQPAPKNRLAIVFAGKVQSAPTVHSTIQGGKFQIFGGATELSKEQAQELAVQLSPAPPPTRAIWS